MVCRLGFVVDLGNVMTVTLIRLVKGRSKRNAPCSRRQAMPTRNNVGRKATNGLKTWAFLLIAWGAFWLFNSGRDWRRTAPFREQLQEFTAISDVQPIKPYIRGKILIVDNTNNIVPKAQSDLPDDLRALRPEEVTTVVLLNRDDTKIGNYVDQSSRAVYSAYKREVTISVVDSQTIAGHRRNVAVGGTILYGSDPPPQAGADAWGSDPIGEVVPYLESLPRAPQQSAALK